MIRLANQLKSGYVIVKSDDIGFKLSACSGMGEYTNKNSFTISWVDPDDVTLNGATLVEWNQTVLVRKVGGYPADPTDGTVLATTSRALGNKNAYRTTGYTDLEWGSETTYYYKLFSQTTAGIWNNLSANEFAGVTNLSWGMIQNFVREGLGPTMFPVGTVFEVDHPEYYQNGHGIRFRVVGYDQVPAQDDSLTHTMCLDMVDILFRSKFDGGEMTYALTTDIIAQSGKIYYAYSNGDYIALSEGTDWTAGDAVPTSSWYEKNLDNRYLGSNDFETSNLLQWANSSGDANQWFVPKTIFDVCHSVFLLKNGFCKNIDPLFLEVVQEAKIITAKSIPDGGGSSTVFAKFFPLSQTQVFGTMENSVQENIQLSYYQSAESRIKVFNGSAVDWWLRSPYTPYQHTTHMTAFNGSLQWMIDSADYGISLACIIA